MSCLVPRCFISYDHIAGSVEGMIAVFVDSKKVAAKSSKRYRNKKQTETILCDHPNFETASKRHFPFTRLENILFSVRHQNLIKITLNCQRFSFSRRFYWKSAPNICHMSKPGPVRREVDRLRAKQIKSQPRFIGCKVQECGIARWATLRAGSSAMVFSSALYRLWGGQRES